MNDKKSNNLCFIEKIFLSIFSFLIPTQLAYHFWPNSSYVFGLRIDYLSPTIYLTDLLLAMTFVVSYLCNRNFKFKYGFVRKHKYLLMFVLIISIFNLIVSNSFVTTSFKLFKVIELSMLFVFIYQLSKNSFINYVIKPLLLSGIYASAIGISQFLISKTTNVMWILGERSFNIQSPGIALFQFNGKEFLRAYSTFPHPNVFAGYLALLIIFLMLFKNNLNRIWQLLFPIFLSALIVTYSKSAFLGIAIVFVFYQIKNVICIKKYFFLFPTIFAIASLLFMFASKDVISQEYIRNRLLLALYSKELFTENIFFGIGLGTFTKEVAKFARDISLLQPVHNIYILILIELGIFGLGIFILLITKIFKQIKKVEGLLPLFLILTISLFDHYFLTLQQTQIIFAGIAAATFKKHFQVSK